MTLILRKSDKSFAGPSLEAQDTVGLRILSSRRPSTAQRVQFRSCCSFGKSAWKDKPNYSRACEERTRRFCRQSVGRRTVLGRDRINNY